MKNSVKICKYNFGKVEAGELRTRINFEVIRVLDVQLQHDDLVVWAEVDSDCAVQQDTEMVVECVWTGFTPPDTESSDYVKTVTDSSGLVYHVYLLH